MDVSKCCLLIEKLATEIKILCELPMSHLASIRQLRQKVMLVQVALNKSCTIRDLKIEAD